MSTSRISVLKNDPAFAELLEHYRNEVSEEFTDVLDRLKMVSLDAVQDLHEKLESGQLTFAQTMSLAQLALDRSGYGPQTKVDSRTAQIVLSSEDIKDIKDNRKEKFAENLQTITQDRSTVAISGPGLDRPQNADGQAEAGGEGERVSV